EFGCGPEIIVSASDSRHYWRTRSNAARSWRGRTVTGGHTAVAGPDSRAVAFVSPGNARSFRGGVEAALHDFRIRPGAPAYEIRWERAASTSGGGRDRELKETRADGEWHRLSVSNLSGQPTVPGAGTEAAGEQHRIAGAAQPGGSSG